MPRSEAQIAASRANGLKGRGPVTPEGKAISRANACKHGMAGDGVVVPEGDAAEVERRSAAMLEEMRPTCEMGRFLVKRMARLTVRVERCSSNELAMNAHRAAHARGAFDEARLAEVDRMVESLAREPATLVRRLRSMPEGVDRMIGVLAELRRALGVGLWDWTCGDRLANLMGSRWESIPVPRARALSEAIEGNFRLLAASEGEGLPDRERAAWARAEMISLIDAEIEGLRAHRETLDESAIERDREGAEDRSAFDPSKEATLARRYEAAAERAVFKALEEFRRVEEEAASGLISPAVEAEEESEEDGILGSFGAGVASPPRPGLGRPTHRRSPMPIGSGGLPAPRSVGRSPA
jgi:hypothetical protein